MYEGLWQKGKEEGIGKITFKDGNWYEGSWIAGSKQGYGEYHYKNGGYYKGQWLNNKEHGDGIYDSGTGSPPTKGIWRNGEIANSTSCCTIF